MRLDFDSGPFVVALNFRDDLLSGFELEANVPSGPAFVARSENEFGWRDPKGYGARTCELLFERDAKGRTTMLTLRASNTLLAKRKK